MKALLSSLTYFPYLYSEQSHSSDPPAEAVALCLSARSRLFLVLTVLIRLWLTPTSALQKFFATLHDPLRPCLGLISTPLR